jgi:hypothetical protein
MTYKKVILRKKILKIKYFFLRGKFLKSHKIFITLVPGHKILDGLGAKGTVNGGTPFAIIRRGLRSVKCLPFFY